MIEWFLLTSPVGGPHHLAECCLPDERHGELEQVARAGRQRRSARCEHDGIPCQSASLAMEPGQIVGPRLPAAAGRLDGHVPPCIASASRFSRSTIAWIGSDNSGSSLGWSDDGAGGRRSVSPAPAWRPAAPRRISGRRGHGRGSRRGYRPSPWPTYSITALSPVLSPALGGR